MKSTVLGLDEEELKNPQNGHAQKFWLSKIFQQSKF
jgi:hypothetical protein